MVPNSNCDCEKSLNVCGRNIKKKYLPSQENDESMMNAAFHKHYSGTITESGRLG